jgi:hypothetical protein
MVDWQGFPAAGDLRETSGLTQRDSFFCCPEEPVTALEKVMLHHVPLCAACSEMPASNARRKEKTAGVNPFCQDPSLCFSTVLPLDPPTSPSPAERGLSTE